MMMKTKTLTFRISTEMYNYLKSEAEQKKITISLLVLRSITESLGITHIEEQFIFPKKRRKNDKNNNKKDNNKNR